MFRELTQLAGTEAVLRFLTGYADDLTVHCDVHSWQDLLRAHQLFHRFACAWLPGQCQQVFGHVKASGQTVCGSLQAVHILAHRVRRHHAPHVEVRLNPGSGGIPIR